MWNEFMGFLSKYNVMGLAVAFFLDIYPGALVQALVTYLIMPVITLVLSPDVLMDIQVGPATFKIGSLRNFPDGQSLGISVRPLLT